MEVDVGADDSAPARGKKRPPSPATPPSDDGEDSSMSTTSDDDEWEVSDSGSEGKEEDVDENEEDVDEKEEDVEANEGICRPFTVDDFPRLSSDHFVQTDTIYRRRDLHRRGPSPLSLFRAFKDPVSVQKGSHVFSLQYRLSDESELIVSNAGAINCSDHCNCKPTDLLQFIDLKIAGYHHAQPGRAKIFGFFAARDEIKPLRNYVYRRGIDNYEAVPVKQKTGMARISLTSPARGICITSRVLFEFKLCIRTEDPHEDEPKEDILIEGCTEITNLFETESFFKIGRLYGEKCGLDVKFLVLNGAVQATVDVEILRAPDGGINLKLYAKTSGFSDVIRLFQGFAEVGCRLSSVVAVLTRSHLDLCIKRSPKDNSQGSSMDNILPQKSCETWMCRFYSCYHGTAEESVNFDDFTTISVKVTWKAVDRRRLWH